MPRETFDRELKRLQDETLVLGSIVENALTQSVAALKKRDFAASHQLIEQDSQINERRFAIESDALILLATQQPIASDLRTIAAVLEITTEPERIGDHAKGTAKINLLVGDKPLVKPLIDLPVMAEQARRMLHQALDAFVRRDVDLARSIPAEDDVIDGLYNQVYRELLTHILQDSTLIEQANFLLWVAHNLERTGDRVINICERVVFTVTGELEELDVKEGVCITPEAI